MDLAVHFIQWRIIFEHLALIICVRITTFLLVQSQSDCVVLDSSKCFCFFLTMKIMQYNWERQISFNRRQYVLTQGGEKKEET